jgi:hypothetical protein
MSRRRSNVDTATAVAAMWMAATLAALRYSGDRIGTAGRVVGGRVRRLATESGSRGAVAYHALRGDLPLRARRRRAEYLGMTVLGGAAGALTVLGIRRMVVQYHANSGHTAEFPGTDREPEPTPAGNLTA